MFKSQKGITLVALVITIIVLLILAGVSISLVVGQNGVLGKATNAVNANEVATVKQEIQLSIADAQMAYYDAWTSDPSVKKSTYFANPIYYSNNCTSASSVDIASDSEVKADTNPAVDEGTVKVTYTSKANVTYTATFDIESPSDINVTK